MLVAHNTDTSELDAEEAFKQLAVLQARVALSERTVGTGSFRFTPDLSDVDWSPGLFRILGLDPTKPTVRNALINMAHPDDRDVILGAVASVKASPGPFYVRYRIIRIDGSERHVEINGDVETDENGAMTAYVGIMTDITRRVETEEHLRSAVDAFRMLTEEANDLICRHNPSMDILYCSPAITRMLGYDPTEVLGNSFRPIIHADDMPAVAKMHIGLLKPGASASIVTRMNHKDGRLLWVETVCRAVGDPATGRVHEIITVSRDVTTRKLAELEITKARETAESANRTKSRFLATMSHELRTPLNAIIGFSDMIKTELFGAITPRYREYAELIHESGTLLLDLINDILDMSKIEAGRFELAIEQFDLVETLDSCVRMLKPKAEQSGLVLDTVHAGMTEVEGDNRAIKQIVLNLMSNAMKFTPRGGSITLSAKECGHQVALAVIDTGVGIPECDLSRLGRPFEQVTQDVTLAKSGTGLGLALVRSLAQLHGGELVIQSQEGRGTTVTVLLPKTRMQVAA